MPRLSLALSSLLVIAACGTSVTPSTAQPSSLSSVTATISGAQAAGTPGPTASSGASASPGRTNLPCADVMSAWEQASTMLDLLANLESDGAWSAGLAPDSPVELDPDALEGWMDRLASLPGQSDTIQVMRRVIPLFRAAVRSGKPFSESSGLGPRLLDAARDAASLAGVEITTALEIRGCTEV